MPAHAQVVSESLLVDADYPNGFQVYRQLGVTENGDGSPWAANGIKAGSFTIMPKLGTEVASTSNAFQSETGAIATPFVTISPSVQAYSNWSRHWIGLVADGDFARYIGHARRNENRWTLSASGALNLTSALSATGQVSAEQIALNRFSGELSNVAASVAIIRQKTALAGLAYAMGKAKASAGVEFYNLDFQRILLSDGSASDQSNRNHNVVRLNGQLEYSPVPDLTFFVQGLYAHFNYYQLLSPSLTTSNFSSVRGVAGLRWELQGLARVTVAGGYARRNFSGLGLPAVGRASVEGRVEIFPSAFTTLTVEAMHRMSEARLIDSSPLMQDSLHVRASYEPRRNLIFNVDGNTLRQNYLLATQVSRIQSLAFSGRLLVSPNWELGARLVLSRRHTTSFSTDYVIQETNGGLSATFKL
ncbi:outer membrane beta-barrel protein [Novosphingobium pituita]|uniref:Uncharacterized protein n=1 Tax=Novosphingobium pituita TaxID=3056842 RepID=A0ABQ6PBV0_9SPHN|nr:outer membrane beta-barrel protein [Novosphingobium sp. IK01]GMM61919.1 hypothetical protein NUTIK01_26960 [Novosphingobium sp. IK01]